MKTIYLIIKIHYNEKGNYHFNHFLHCNCFIQPLTVGYYLINFKNLHKMKNRTLQINGISEFYGPAYCEAQGLAKVFQAYADYCVNECIMDGGIGFNENSGYVYIALENGVTICSMLGNEVEYIVTNFDTGNEYFFDTYEEAITFEVDSIN